MEAGTQTEEKKTEGDGNVGTVEEIQGVVIEVAFPDELPEIYNALEVDLERYGDEENEEEAGTLVLEVQQHLGDDRVRAVAMDATDGLSRGTKVRDTGGPITVPVGRETLGRIFNLLGEPIDEGGEVETEERWPIHRPAPASRTSRRRARSSRRASRSSTCSPRTPRAARLACSAAREWARPSSSRS